MEEFLRAMILATPGIPPSVDWGARKRGATLPGIVLNVVSDLSEHTQDGPDGLSEARVQVDVYAASYGEAKAISRTLRRALDGAEQGIINGCFLVMSRDSSEEGEAGSGDRVYRALQDFQIFYRFDP